jgi:antitoxin (DNA-binding transcriptional repressor) of toxin-antitoxin stability system
MKTIEITNENDALTQYTDGLEKGDVVVLTKNDEPVAALVSLEDIDTDSLSLSTNPDFLRIIERSRQSFNEGRTLSADEMRAAVAKME